jgi:putative transcriptional regulator
MLMEKRDIFGELMEGAATMESHREGKLTLRSYKVAAAPLPKVDSKLIRDTRKRLRCSRAVFARRLRINERTLEKWEQGRAKPNPQAAALVLLVRRYPDTLARLDEVAAREALYGYAKAKSIGRFMDQVWQQTKRLRPLHTDCRT